MVTESKYIYITLHKQIRVMIALSIIPGLGYVFLGWLNDIVDRALIWYVIVIVISVGGEYLHRAFNYDVMSGSELFSWRRKLSIFYSLIFGSWALIFVLYANETSSNMHYIAIFTELGASVVATTLLFADRKILRPILLVLMLPLSVYFSLIGEFYAYVLTLFSLIFTGVLFYSAHSSAQLLEKTQYQASHDQLTNLYNRHSFIDALQIRINDLERKAYFSFLLLIDLDHFKTVNDSLGHDVGDALLEEVALRLSKLSGEKNIIARLGGDEFVFLGRDFQSHEDALARAMEVSDELLKSLKSTYVIAGHKLYLSASVGVSLLSPERLNANVFMKEADIAMYEVKNRGRDGVIVFNDELSKRVQSHLEIEKNLHFALEREEVYLQYQPQFNLAKGLIGCEVLVRWKSKELGFVPPDIFIPIAEQTGDIIPLGEFILEEAFKTLVSWKDKGITVEQFSINISMRQLFYVSFSEDIKALCQKHLDESLQKKLIFEITETLLAEDMTKVVAVMRGIKDSLGIRFSMDDFGTGYSSLSYLQQMPIDELKIDRSFISELSEDKNDQKMVRIIMAMAHTFDLKVVAEGVETQEHYQFLEKHQCDIVQGYLFSKPLDKKDFESFYSECKPA